MLLFIKKFREVVAFTLFLLLLLPLTAQAQEPVEPLPPAPDTSDVRVLIDVSGSMKKNDPKNLRAPALRLLVGLLPPESQSAVWNFGEKVTPLVPMSTTDDDWKAKATKASQQIHSKELFTDIGAALEAAIDGWEETETPEHKRSIILLTDGMVDISKDDVENVVERRRILEEMLPRLQALKVNVHTIALSENADKEFLQALSQQTDGGFEQTDDAEQLQRIFLHMFEKTTKRDTVPLVNNEFKVDSSIFEMTLLIFSSKDAPETEVVQPDGVTFTQSTAPANVKWQHEQSYDLLTITKPMLGEWSVNAATDPDNRVMVVTNLQIQSSRLPNNIFMGEVVEFAVNLSENDKLITDDDFLSVVSMSVTQEGEQVKQRWFLHDNGLSHDRTAHDGIFNLQLNETLKSGKNQFFIKAAGATFERQFQHNINVYDNLLLNSALEVYQEDGVKRHRVSVSPNLEFVRANATQISAKITDSVGEVTDAKLIRAGSNQLVWHLDTSELSLDKHYSVNFLMKTRSRLGRPIKYISPAIPLDFSTIKDELPEPPPPAQEANEEIAAQETDTPMPVDVEGEESEESDSSLWTIIIAILVNLLVGVGGWFGYRHWKKKRNALLDSVTEGLE